jgi:hypothetical protein
MEFKGDGFKYFFNNESKTREEIVSLINDNTTVSIKGLDVFYNSPKTNKTEDLLKEAEQHQENNGGRADLEFLVDEITTGFSFYPKESKIFTYNPKYLNDKNLNLEEVTKIITEERIIDNLNKVEGIKETEGVKLNKNKPQISLLFKQFPKALEAIVMCSEYGHKKYKETDKDFINFKRVEGGSKTYADAGLRHRLGQGKDSESGLPHQYHVAWNALAELQLWIQEHE